MKRVISFLSIIVFVAGCKEPARVDKRVPVNGTPVSVQLPAGFYADPTIAGFRHNIYSATILVMSIPIEYHQALVDMAKDKLAAVGQQLVSREDVKVNGAEGVLCKLYYEERGMNFYQWRLIVPERGNTLTVNGTFTADQDKEISGTVRDALLTTQVDPVWKPDTASISFRVRPPADLKLAKVFEGPSVMYTHDGSWTNDAIFSYSMLMGRNAHAVDKKSIYALESFRQLCSTCIIEHQDSTLVVDGLPGIEVWGTRTDSLATRLKYQAILFDSTMSYYVVGTADKAHADKLEDFRASVRTWRKR
ncbi:hypothetical protein KK062_09545 [Fulvivirgaceae bacterium PWU5]|uniref:Uncharacterized protein n=1 Tax=Dawidia cretensis TaxID=2782350 RepID=A0AAP2DYD0_9BACT|nr:hypothetical protein [Dawidia cretensis]MBT1708468.1 hypothetical protein [Dawidia cretensis]